MEEQLINFETAKLAKEKGFDEKVYREYDKFGYLRCTSKSADVVLGPYEELLKSTEYPASTQSLLQKWLREVHNIIIEPIYNQVYNYFDLIICNISTRFSNHIKAYSTYEEVLEIGLQEGLKLIK